MSRAPVDDLNLGNEFYARILPDVNNSHFAPMWHIFSVGHLVAVDLDRIARRFGLSFADIHLLGTVRIERDTPLRATDLTRTLHVSNAVLSTRIQKLVDAGLLIRERIASDRRAYTLTMTARGTETVDAAIRAVASDARIAHHLQKLAPADRDAITRLIGGLHEQLDREFIAAERNS